MLADYHVHTAYSDDSDYPMEQVVRDAIDKGIRELCFTDHVDYGVKRDWDDPRGISSRPGGPGEPEVVYRANVDYPRYFRELETLRERYRERITLRAGLEFGAQTHTLPRFEALSRRWPLDFVILSVHQIGDRELWNHEYQNLFSIFRCAEWAGIFSSCKAKNRSQYLVYCKIF